MRSALGALSVSWLHHMVQAVLVVYWLFVGCVLILSWLFLGCVLAVSCCVFRSQSWKKKNPNWCRAGLIRDPNAS